MLLICCGHASKTHTQNLLGPSGVEHGHLAALWQGRWAMIQLAEQVCHQNLITPSQDQQFLQAAVCRFDPRCLMGVGQTMERATDC